MSTWSGIRNKLENDYLCPALRGHIQYFATSYSKSADHEGRAAIRMDGVEVLRSNYYIYFENVWTKLIKNCRCRLSAPAQGQFLGSALPCYNPGRNLCRHCYSYRSRCCIGVLCALCQPVYLQNSLLPKAP